MSVSADQIPAVSWHACLQLQPAMFQVIHGFKKQSLANFVVSWPDSLESQHSSFVYVTQLYLLACLMYIFMYLAIKFHFISFHLLLSKNIKGLWHCLHVYPGLLVWMFHEKCYDGGRFIIKFN
jgi:hypothetical protein